MSFHHNVVFSVMITYTPKSEEKRKKKKPIHTRSGLQTPTSLPFGSLGARLDTLMHLFRQARIWGRFDLVRRKAPRAVVVVVCNSACHTNRRSAAAHHSRLQPRVVYNFGKVVGAHSLNARTRRSESAVSGPASSKGCVSAGSI